MDDLTEAIEDAANGPKSMRTGMGEAVAQPLPDLIEADQYLTGKAAAAGVNPQGGAVSGWGCLRWARAIPPGSR